jgi:hypothetical protein
MLTNVNVEWPQYVELDERLRALEQFDPAPVLDQWAPMIYEGNRRGVLAGVDGHEVAMPPLKYRTGAGKATGKRKAGMFGTRTAPKTGAGPWQMGLHDNLSTTEMYQHFDGPRLAPRRDSSRVIKNLEVHWHQLGDGVWEVIGSWFQVISMGTKKKSGGVPFLPFHFNGEGHNPKYDLRPVRPKELEWCINVLKAHVRTLFRERF